MPDGASHIEIREVGAQEGYDLIAPLLPYHYAEVAKFKDVAELAPDIDRYLALEKIGALCVLIARCDDLIVGYSANFLSTNLHYRKLSYAQNDVLYVVPEHRQSGVGIKLIRQTVRLVKARGASLMLWHAKPDTSLNAVLPRLGYEVMDVIWARKI